MGFYSQRRRVSLQEPKPLAIHIAAVAKKLIMAICEVGFACGNVGLYGLTGDLGAEFGFEEIIENGCER